MAKIKHNNFMDTVDAVITGAKNEGVVHLYAEGESFGGRTIRIKGKDLFHFGTTGYLGLEQDERLKEAAVEAIRKYGTQFPLSKTYISHPLYRELEERLFEMYGNPVIVTKNSTLGHMAVIPCVVRDEDAVILDHQVHWSVQHATQILKTRGVPVEMVRHNDLGMLESKIKELSGKAAKIWYMADGVYSMYGDYAPIPQLLELCNRYPQLHLYFDDVHGMSWKGHNGMGYVMDVLKELPDQVLLFGTLSKTFGASGAVLVSSNKDLHRKIKNFGGPLTFSAQLEPASVAAASASAAIHLSDEIYTLQEELQERIVYFNELLVKTDLPLIERNTSPVFYIGTGMPGTGYNFVQRMMNEGFFVNLGLYPAVPVKNTGVRITLSRHNQMQEIENLVEAMVYHYPKALESSHTSLDRVRKAFRLPVARKEVVPAAHPVLDVQYEKSISRIDKAMWNDLMGKKGTFDWEGQQFLEEVFSGGEEPEHNWSFHYYVIRDREGMPVLATFFTRSLWKDDMLAPASISLKLEEKRKEDLYHLTSQVLNMGSLFSEGEHLFINSEHPQAAEAVTLLLKKLEELDQEMESSLLVLRDFDPNNNLDRTFHDHGFIKVAMPESCILEDLNWNNLEEYVAGLSPRSRKHFKKEIAPYEKLFEVKVQKTPTPMEIGYFYELYKQVKNNNPGLNTFTYPERLFKTMAGNPHWEFLVLYLKEEYDDRKARLPVGVMFCYKNLEHTFVPCLIGMDYAYSREFQVYRQLLFQTIKRAKDLNFKKIDFGFTASFEKRKVGASVYPKVSYVQAKDNFSMEVLGVMQSEG